MVAAQSLGQRHTHQMPTSLLLLRIQVSAALKLAEGLLVTFCGADMGVSPPRRPLPGHPES